MALAFFLAAFLPADFNFRLRMAFFVVALRFLGMGNLPFNRGLAHSDSGPPRSQRNRLLDARWSLA
jgi:hypothetical protein